MGRQRDSGLLDLLLLNDPSVAVCHGVCPKSIPISKTPVGPLFLRLPKTNLGLPLMCDARTCRVSSARVGSNI
jgi:hypothetical protein